MAKKKNPRKYSEDINTLSLSIIGGFFSGGIILAGSKIQEVFTSGGYKTLGDILFVLIIVVPIIWVARTYKKNLDNK